MKTVWKFPILPGETVEMPLGAEVISIGEQGAGCVLWALVDSDEPIRTKRSFVVAGTGHTIDKPLGRFIGTVQFRNGLVFHFWEAVA